MQHRSTVAANKYTMQHKTRVLVTGCNGFIGRNMVEWLAHQGFEVDGWDWDPDKDNWPRVELYDWVVHLGGLANETETDVEKVLKQNLDFSQWIFTQCNRAGVNLQYASSSAVYGDVRSASEFSPCSPVGAFAWSKYLFDRWVFDQQQHVYVQGFRYFEVYGQYMGLRGPNASVIYTWREQARKHGKIQVNNDAERQRGDFVWVGDVCRLHTDFINTVKGSGIWNCGTGLSHPYLDIAEEIAEQENAVIEVIDAAPCIVRPSSCADLTRLKETVGRRKWLNVFEYLKYENGK